MINLKTFFKIHFDTRYISDDNLKKFTQVHIFRLTANNTGGKYTSMLAVTQAAYTTYFGAISKEDIEFSDQQSKTQAVDAIIETFKKMVKKQEGLLSVKLDEGSTDYNKFFPYGMSEYTNVTKANIETLMQRFTHFAAEYEAQLGGEFLQIFETLYTTYNAVRGQQLAKISDVVKDRQETSVNRNVLEKQLMTNVLTLAIEYMGHTEMVDVFFDQSILRTNANGDEIFWEGNINANATVTIVERSFTAGTQMLLRNTGEAQLSFCLAPAEGIACGNNNIVVDGMSEKQIGIEDMGNIVNMFLNVTNMNVNEEGRFEAEIVS